MAKDTFVYEQEAHKNGKRFVCGLDEAGRGTLAGPVVAAAVMLSENFHCPDLDDSKKLSDKKRREILAYIYKSGSVFATGISDNREIDAGNILKSTKKAMMRAVEALSRQPDYLLIDAVKLGSEIPELSLIKGESKSASIAAASIVAKVTRDDIMNQYSVEYPGYGFAKNKGYGTHDHIDAIRKHGPCPIHRMTFRKVTAAFSPKTLELIANIRTEPDEVTLNQIVTVFMKERFLYPLFEAEAVEEEIVIRQAGLYPKEIADF